MRNVMQTSQTLVKKMEDVKIIFQFTFTMILFYIGLVFILFFTPLRNLILNGIMGLTLELSEYSVPALKLMLLLSVFWGISYAFRGVLSAIRKTGPIAVTAAIRLVVVVAFGCIVFLGKNLNGAVIGVLVFIGAFASEAVVLGWFLKKERWLPGTLLPQQKERI
jgi:Na+-driven multidrug efflux pump